MFSTKLSTNPNKTELISDNKMSCVQVPICDFLIECLQEFYNSPSNPVRISKDLGMNFLIFGTALWSGRNSSTFEYIFRSQTFSFLLNIKAEKCIEFLTSPSLNNFLGRFENSLRAVGNFKVLFPAGKHLIPPCRRMLASNMLNVCIS